MVIPVAPCADARFCNRVYQLLNLACTDGCELTVIYDLRDVAIRTAFVDGTSYASHVRGYLELAIGVPWPHRVPLEAVVTVLYSMISTQGSTKVAIAVS